VTAGHHHHHHAVGAGAAVLDIGGDVGALVVVLGDHPDVEELEIRPAGDPAGRFHTGVHVRAVGVGGGEARVAVYPEVRAGDYELLDADLRPFEWVSVRGGEVTTLDLR
jgi:hypothetical protein